VSGRDDNEGRRFYPDYLFEILLSILLALQVLLVLALLFPPHPGRPINLTGQYEPKPEWYFLWLYQLIRYFPGRTAALGTVIIPVVIFAVVAAVPFIDRHGKPRDRRLAVMVVASIFTGVCLLTALSSF